MDVASRKKIDLQSDLHIDPAETCTQIVDFIRGQVKRLGKRGVILGLSGGMDSSTCAYLCTIALGRERIQALRLPERDTDPINMSHASLVAENLGLEVKDIDLSPVLSQIGLYDEVPAGTAADRSKIEAGVRWMSRLSRRPSTFAFGLDYAYGERRTFWENLVRRFFWRSAGQIQAFVFTKVRLRMLMLYYHASLSDCLVIGTTDKSEWSIGFYDRYGDGASDITLLQHLYKTQIKELARYLGVPEEIIQKPSSGDLAAGIPNEVFIGLDYEQLDMILYGLEHEMPVESIMAMTGLNKKAVQTVKQASQRARFRESLPLHL